MAACLAELPKGGEAPTEILLAPAGTFRARDGRPHGLPGWHLNAELAAAIIAAAKKAKGDFLIDYEHQTLYAEENGKEAPAAGWWSADDMQWREGEGLVALNVRWTKRAADYIAGEEYRYISPVIEYNPNTGEVLGIAMAALVNYPAIEGNSDLTARAAAKFSTHSIQKEDATVNREQLIALLGLANDATDEVIQAALKAHKADSEALAALRGELGVGEDDDATAAIATLKTQKAEPDMALYVPKAVHDETRAQLAALKTNSHAAEIETLLKEGLDDGRIAGKATADWLRAQGIEALKAHLADAPNLAALKTTQTGGKKPAGERENGQLNDSELAVCKAMGIKSEDYQKANA